MFLVGHAWIRRILKFIKKFIGDDILNKMAMRKSATQVLKRCFDSGKGLSWNPAPLGSSMRVVRYLNIYFYR